MNPLEEWSDNIAKQKGINGANDMRVSKVVTKFFTDFFTAYPCERESSNSLTADRPTAQFLSNQHTDERRLTAPGAADDNDA